jgi:hypothetical protein
MAGGRGWPRDLRPNCPVLLLRAGFASAVSQEDRCSGVDAERLSDKHVARLVKQTALAAGVRSDLPEGRTCAAVLRALAPRRSCFLGRHRGALCSKTARPCLGRDDPQISAAARSLPHQSHPPRGFRRPLPCPRDETVRSRIATRLARERTLSYRDCYRHEIEMITARWRPQASDSHVLP